MATADKVKADKTTDTDNGAGKSRFTKVITDRPMYRVDKCGDMPLVGRLLGLGAMPKAQLTEQQKRAGQTGEWNAYVILTTEPTLTCKADGPAEKTPVGVEVLLGESAKLTELRKFLFHDKIIEVSITTTGKVDLKGGKTMRTYDILADFEGTIPRPARYALPEAGLPPTKQVAVEGDEDDIGF